MTLQVFMHFLKFVKLYAFSEAWQKDLEKGNNGSVFFLGGLEGVLISKS